MRLRRPVLALIAALLAFGPVALPVAAASNVTLEARALLQGHTRAGSWMTVEVRVSNGGPAVTGELRLAGGSQGHTRFGVAVDLPTGSRKSFFLHAQPPAFGRSLTVDLVSAGSTVASTDVAYLVHDASQLVVGVVAARPQAIVAELDLPAGVNGAPAVVVPLAIADLPDRVEAWATLDRLVWQDVDSNQLSKGQLAALRGWLAAGGRLVVTGGTGGIATLAAFPDDLLPYRPTATVDLPAAAIAPLVEGLPADAPDLPSMAGSVTRGRSLLSVGDRAVAAEMTYGSGSVTLLGFDPATPSLVAVKGIAALWQRYLPPRFSGGGVAVDNDSNLISAVAQLPVLALPPVGGLLLLLAAYVLIIGPINYLVLRRLDRRELAWVTMPVLVVGFAVASYAYGSLVRGGEVILNEIAIVRGGSGVTDGQAQVYLGLFSPTRGTYDVTLPGGALVASPISAEFGGGTGADSLDVLQGDPARVRGLEIGYGSLRAIRADTPTTVPRLDVSLALKDGVITGRIDNTSDEPLEQVAVVVGNSVAVVGDLAAHSSGNVSLTPASNLFGQMIADRIVGQPFQNGPGIDDSTLKRAARFAMLNQLTFDPNTGMNRLSAEGPVVLAFADKSIIDVTVAGQSPRRSGRVLYVIPADLGISGHVVFESDLIRAVPLSIDQQFFAKEPSMISMGPGTTTVAYRTIPFRGSLAATELRIAITFGGGGVGSLASGEKIEPLPSPPTFCTDAANTTPQGCTARANDGLPYLQLWDVAAGAWKALPHLANATAYSVSGASRFVDAGSGQVLVRFVNPSQDGGIAFALQMAIVGDVR